MRVEPELPSHPKFARLKVRIGEVAMECLVRIWAHCQQNQRGEFWRNADAEYLELIADWDGQPGLLFTSLTDPRINFVQVEDGGLRIHDWNEMNAQIVTNWKNGPKGGRPRSPHKTGAQNPLVNPTQTKGVTGVEPANGTGLPAISGDAPLNPTVNPKPDSVNQLETQRKPYQRNETEHNGTNHGGAGGMRYDLAQECIVLLNERTGSSFPLSHATLTETAQRLFEVQNDAPGVKQMIERQVKLWAGDQKFKNWLRPSTLFNEEKFPNYYGQRELPANGNHSDRRAELQQLIDESRANRSSVYHSTDATAEEKANLKKWRQELSTVQTSGPKI